MYGSELKSSVLSDAPVNKGKTQIIGSDKSLSPVQRQCIIWHIADLLLIGFLEKHFSECQITCASRNSIWKCLQSRHHNMVKPTLVTCHADEVPYYTLLALSGRQSASTSSTFAAQLHNNGRPRWNIVSMILHYLHNHRIDISQGVLILCAYG